MSLCDMDLRPWECQISLLPWQLNSVGVRSFSGQFLRVSPRNWACALMIDCHCAAFVRNMATEGQKPNWRLGKQQSSWMSHENSRFTVFGWFLDIFGRLFGCCLLILFDFIESFWHKFWMFLDGCFHQWPQGESSTDLFPQRRVVSGGPGLSWDNLRCSTWNRRASFYWWFTCQCC